MDQFMTSLGETKMSVPAGCWKCVVLSCALAISAFHVHAQSVKPVPAVNAMSPVASAAGKVRLVNASVALVSSANPATAGSSITLSATVRGLEPTGSVTFKSGDTTLGTVPCANATAALTTTALSAGEHAITAVYGGDSKNLMSTSEVLVLTVH
jgi:hypothetical protein